MFTADTSAAGKYNILASVPGYASQTTAPALTLTTVNSVINKDLVMTP